MRPLCPPHALVPMCGLGEAPLPIGENWPSSGDILVQASHASGCILGQPLRLCHSSLGPVTAHDTSPITLTLILILILTLNVILTWLWRVFDSRTSRCDTPLGPPSCFVGSPFICPQGHEQAPFYTMHDGTRAGPILHHVRRDTSRPHSTPCMMGHSTQHMGELDWYPKPPGMTGGSYFGLSRCRMFERHIHIYRSPAIMFR